MHILRSVAVLAVSGALLAGCGSSGNDDRTARLEAQVAALQSSAATTTTSAPTSTTSEAPTTTTSTTSTTSTTVVVADPTVQAMTRWMAFHSDDMEAVTAAAATIGFTHPISLGAQNCQRLVTIARGAKEGLPVPVATVTVHYSKALGLYEQAGAACSTEAGADTLYAASQFLKAAAPEMTLAEQALGIYVAAHHL